MLRCASRPACWPSARKRARNVGSPVYSLRSTFTATGGPAGRRGRARPGPCRRWPAGPSARSGHRAAARTVPPRTPPSCDRLSACPGGPVPTPGDHGRVTTEVQFSEFSSVVDVGALVDLVVLVVVLVVAVVVLVVALVVVDVVVVPVDEVPVDEVPVDVVAEVSVGVEPSSADGVVISLGVVVTVDTAASESGSLDPVPCGGARSPSTADSFRVALSGLVSSPGA